MAKAVHSAKGRQGPEEPGLEGLEKFISMDEKSHAVFHAGRERLVQKVLRSECTVPQSRWTNREAPEA